MKQADVLLAISESSSREVTQAVECNTIRVETISAACDNKFKILNSTDK